MLALALLVLTAAPAAPAPPLAPLQASGEVSPFSLAMDRAERALAGGDMESARALVIRALERDARSPEAWALRGRWAEKAGDRDEQVYALHKELRLRLAQGATVADTAGLRERLAALDPLAADLLGMSTSFVQKLREVADQYEKEGRPHSAIRVHKEILALAPENALSQAAIERLAAAPDPSLAADAKPKDLLADVSAEWIREFDAKHGTWKERAKLERENYVTHTDAGYEVLVRCAEAMEQMNAFYRQFFDYKTDGSQVGRIDLNIFKTRDGYLTLGMGPPVEWSGGHFTGGAVETYIGDGGFEGMVGTLFHEAAHQFVSLATSASGWLNEGLASFFEGCRILANGTVLMNMPANGRLFPLAERMEQGWMSSVEDGIDPKDPSKSDPKKAPTFRIVLENRYEWGPPWYAPTWGVVYFLYNYQDPVDGRYVYRKAFREFIDRSGGRMGEGAVENFEEVVLANPQPPIPGVERPEGARDLPLPRTVEELDPVWKDWILRVRDEQLGKAGEPKPWLRWARAAVSNKDWSVAKEHFEKGLVESPRDPDLLQEFAAFLAERQQDTDRAAKLGLEALRILEGGDAARVRALERKLATWDPKRATLERVHKELWGEAQRLVSRYREADLPLMTMDTAWRFGTELRVPDLFDDYEEVLRASGKSLRLWELAYNERDLEGWDDLGSDVFAAAGAQIESSFGAYAADQFDFRMLSLERVTSGDFSLEAQVQAGRGEVNFCGLLFGRKDPQNFHALVLFPPRARSVGEQAGAQLADSGFVDLASFYGGLPKVWRHNPVQVEELAEGESSTGRWHHLRIDVSGRLVDAWLDGELLATQEFPSIDVLRGSFGLITGPGSARYREVRFMSLPAGDTAARIEREVRMELRGGSDDEAVNGSWLGKRPPFPSASRWAQEPRASWGEAGEVPQLLVLWSIRQNDLVPIDAWLRDLAARHEDVGLRVVAVCSPNDADAVDAYLAAHPFPGSLAVDLRPPGEVGFGATNEAYATPRFNLPRLLLLDVDGRIVWEGDPGISSKAAWSPGTETYLDAPLADLIQKRQLRQVIAWRARWETEGQPALRRGALAAAVPVLLEAEQYDREAFPAVHEARLRLERLRATVEALPRLAEQLAASGREPALTVLLDWAAQLGVEVDQRPLRKALGSPEAKHWERALKQVESFRDRVLAEPAKLEDLLVRLAELKGAFPRELADALRAAAGDGERLREVLDTAPRRPQSWALQDQLGL